MKINERTLMHFAGSPDSPADKSGWLWKRGEVNKAFQRRFFVLKGNLLFYFDKDKVLAEPLGVVILEGCTVELSNDEEGDAGFGFKINFHGDGKRTYYLAAESQSDLEAWMKALACASFDYMKLMVAELQQQLDDLDEAERIAGNVEGKSERKNPFQEATTAVGLPNSTSWNSLHFEFGKKILSDRRNWCELNLSPT